MNRRIDGRDVRATLTRGADIVIVGSGPAGASVARVAAAAGASVVIVEAGAWLEPQDSPLSAFEAMGQSYWEMGASVLMSAAPIPYIQGRAVGGSSVINGAICWRLPRDVYLEWARADPAFAAAVPWDSIEAVTDEIEQDLNVLPTEPDVAGDKNLLMARGADALGLEHRPIRRNVRGCRGLGRCLQGCPEGNKLSMDRTYLLDAERDGATLISSTRVTRLLRSRGRIEGIEGVAEGGGRVRIMARRAVVLAASAIHTPALLLRNRLRQGPVGRNFQCHPGVSMAGRFPQTVRMWEGATQGHEVIGLRGQGLKFEALGFGLAILATRLEGIGDALARGLDDIAHWLDWGAAVRAEAKGRVRVIAGQTVIQYSPTTNDVRLFRRGLRVLGELMLAAGAEHVSPGVHGFDARISDPRQLAALELSGPDDPRAFEAAVTHMFGTCAMGSDPSKSVVGLDFGHHHVDRLFVADSSVFPSNTGVNPQIPIMALATLCGRRLITSERRGRG